METVRSETAPMVTALVVTARVVKARGGTGSVGTVRGVVGVVVGRVAWVAKGVVGSACSELAV